MKREPRQRYTYSPFKLRNWRVENDPDGAIGTAVSRHLTALSKLMVANQTEYYQSEQWRSLIQTLAADPETNLAGKKNHAGRLLGVEPPTPPKRNAYNFAEMFRTNILGKAEAYIQRLRVAWLIDQHPDETDYRIQQAYIDLYGLKTIPTCVQIGKIRSSCENGCIQSNPSADGKLPFSATDGHYRQLVYDDECIRFTIPLSDGSRATLVFDRPRDARFHLEEQKIAAPDVLVDDDGKLVFVFSAYQPSAREYEPTGWLGVDLGIVEPYTATVVCSDWFSQSFTASRQVRRLVTRLSNIERQVSQLRAKITLCEESGRFEKAEFLNRELELVVASRSRLKAELARLAARDLVGLALDFGAGLAFEDLSWVPESHWNQADVQVRARCLASRVGVPVVHVPAAGSSRVCARCGEEGSVSGRVFRCSNQADPSVARRERARLRHVELSRRNNAGGKSSCRAKRSRSAVGGVSSSGGRLACARVDRDVNASRVVGLRACGLAVLPVVYKRLVRNPDRVRSIRARCQAPCNTHALYKTRYSDRTSIILEESANQT